MSACRSVLSDDERVTSRVRVRLSPPEDAAVTAAVAPVGWRCLSLSYTVPWPMHLVLTDRSLSRYNRVFQFLILVKRAQLALHGVWAQQMADKSKDR